jgi:plastocyanin
VAPPSAAGSVVGTLELLDRAGAKGPAVDAVVWIPGLSGGAPRPARLTQRNKQFEPHVVVVGKGGTVSFPNSDHIFHNVFSSTPGAEFDLGLYKSGSSKDRAFPRPGVVRVFCNIHPVMTGYVVVLDQPDPVFAVTDAAGRARLTGVPPGVHRVRIWHEKGGEQEVTVDVASGREVSFGAVLDGSRWKNQPHKNKLGEDYPKGERY